MLLLIIWLIMALICYYLAKNKNRNEVVATFAGFIFGIFAIIYYLMVSPLVECPHCGKKISTKDVRCKYCKKK